MNPITMATTPGRMPRITPRSIAGVSSWSAWRAHPSVSRPRSTIALAVLQLASNGPQARNRQADQQCAPGHLEPDHPQEFVLDPNDRVMHSLGQEPRPPADKQAYLNALGLNWARLWELTNTRYVVGESSSFAELLNQKFDPAKRSFRVETRFGLTQAGEGFGR